MPEVDRYSDSICSDYETEDGRSANHNHARRTCTYRTVQRYRVKAGRSEKIQDDRHIPRIAVVPRSERIDVGRPGSITDTETCSSLHEPLRERSQSRIIIQERVFEPENSKQRGHALSTPWQAEVWSGNHTKERRDKAYELEKYQAERDNYYDQNSLAPPPILNTSREEHHQIVKETVRESFCGNDSDLNQEEYYRREPYEQESRSHDVFSSSGRPASHRGIRRAPYPCSDAEYSGDEYMLHGKDIKPERNRSSSPHHKRHLIEGALGGAGVSALLTNHREKSGGKPEHAARNVVGGAAIGAIGGEVLTRARSHYRHGNRSRSRSNSKHSQHNLKKALGLAAVGLAATATAQYFENHKSPNEELPRGRSRTRSRARRSSSHYLEDDAGSRNRKKLKDSKRHSSAIVNTGVATAAVTGMVQHALNKSRNRSQSRLRTGAEITTAGLAGAVVASLYEQHKANEKEHRKESRRRSKTKSRSRARSRGASYPVSGFGSELEMIQYGTEPIHASLNSNIPDSSGAYGAVRHRSHSKRRRHSSSQRKADTVSRSPSRMRHIVGAVAGATAAALGINQYTKHRGKDVEYERDSGVVQYYSRSCSRRRSCSSFRTPRKQSVGRN